MTENEGYENCDECYGWGFVVKGEHTIYRCKECQGLGEIDWVQKVVGIENQFLPPMEELVYKCQKKYNIEAFVIKWNPNWAFVEWIDKRDGRFTIIENKL